MKPNTIFMGWNKSVVGREGHTMELFQKVQAWYAKLQSDGKIESHQTIFLSAHGSERNGFTILQGHPDKIAELRHSEEMISIAVEANYCLEGFALLEGYHGEAMMGLMNKWGAIVAKG